MGSCLVKGLRRFGITVLKVPTYIDHGFLMGHGISFFKQYDDDSIYLLFKHKSLFVGFTEGNLLFDCFKGHILSDILKIAVENAPTAMLTVPIQILIPIRQLRQQPDNFDIQPHERNQQTERAVPFHIFGCTLLCSLFDKVKIEYEIKGRNYDDDNRNSDADRVLSCR